MEAIRRLTRLGNGGLAEYTYIGLGGPYLEDFRLIYELYPEIGMVSIEYEEQTYRRQEFHLPCSTLELIHDDISSYIARYDPRDKKSVFWLDYTRLDYSCFEDFQAVLGTVAEDSMVKITLRSEPTDYWVPKNKGETLGREKSDEFRAKFARVMANPSADPPRELHEFAYLLQGMLQVAAQQALPPDATTLRFVPVSSFYYSDGTGIFTLTGVVCQSARRDLVERVFADWEFSNLAWDPPQLIDLPVLSTKERLHLQHLLPSNAAAGRRLREKLGYRIHRGIPKTEAALEQYAAFHRYSPYVLRGVP